jgi:hypothetical protein
MRELQINTEKIARTLRRCNLDSQEAREVMDAVRFWNMNAGRAFAKNDCFWCSLPFGAVRPLAPDRTLEALRVDMEAL